MPFAARFWERSIGPHSAADLAILKDVRKRCVKRLGPQRATALWAEGEALLLSEAIRLALGANSQTI
jgi:hypothetical protein